MTQAADPEYVWVTRHTWQSWRERYKKNANRLDNVIAAIVDRKKPAQGEKGQYGYVRKPEEKVKKSRKKRSRNVALSGTVPETVYDEDYIGGPIAAAVMEPIALPPPRGGTLIPFALQHMPTVGGGPLDLSVVRESPAEEEMDDTEESAEWQIRIGKDEPPAWAKRKATEEISDDGSNKKTKTR